jgi:hypothetical protein
MYPLILSFETINKLKLSFECGIPRPQDAGHLRFRLFLTLKSDPGQESNLKVSTDYMLLQFFLSNYTVQLQCLQRAPGRRVTEKSQFSTLNGGPAGTGNRTQATCLAGSVSRRSAIHYASVRMLLDHLNLHTNLTLVCQDWGGLTGLSVVKDMPDAFEALVIMNTALPDGSRVAGSLTVLISFYCWRLSVMLLGTRDGHHKI